MFISQRYTFIHVEISFVPFVYKHLPCLKKKRLIPYEFTVFVQFCTGPHAFISENMSFCITFMTIHYSLRLVAIGSFLEMYFEV